MGVALKSKKPEEKKNPTVAAWVPVEEWVWSLAQSSELKDLALSQLWPLDSIHGPRTSTPCGCSHLKKKKNSSPHIPQTFIFYIFKFTEELQELHE